MTATVFGCGSPLFSNSSQVILRNPGIRETIVTS